MNIKKYKNFCVFPFVHVVQNSYNDFENKCSSLPCCRYDNSISNTEFNESIDPINQSPIWSKLQNQFLNDQRPQGCLDCWRNEDLGKKSYRQIGLEWYEEYISSNAFLDKKLRFLEIMLSNVCNLSCKSCSPNFSSKWSDINSYLFNNDFNPYPFNNVSFSNWKNLDLSNLTRLKLMGGEPLYQKEAHELLNYLDSIDVLSQLNIIIPTNCTIFPNNRLLDIFNRAKHVSFSLSIDGVNDLNNYIRSGSRWETIESNIQKYLDLRKEDSNKYFIMSNTVVTSLNINCLTDIKKYLEQYDIESHYDFTPYPSQLYIGILPNHIKEFLKQKIDDNIANQIFDGVKFDIHEFLRLRRFIKLLDEYHGISFKDCNREMWDLIYQTSEHDVS